MDTLYGGRAGKVVELGTISQPWRCQYVDKDGVRCKNDRQKGSIYCMQCHQLMELSNNREMGGDTFV